jgi:hypothetical protein
MVDVYDVYEAAQGMGLSKEIFHYIVAIKNMERKEQAVTKVEDNSLKGPEKPGSAPIHSISRKSVETIKNIKSESSQPPWEATDIGFPKSKFTLKGVKKPWLILLLVIVVLILSIFFTLEKIWLD